MKTAYLILKNMHECLCDYESSEIFVANRGFIEAIRAAVKLPDLSCYKGISREPVEREDAEMLYGDEVIFNSLKSARKRLRGLECMDIYEIVKICDKAAANNDGFLGYDVGYWGSDCFSIICDTAVMQRWHPPIKGDWPELAERLKALNPNLLFDSFNTAKAFREYYLARPWAETEAYSGEIDVVAVYQAKSVCD